MKVPEKSAGNDRTGAMLCDLAASFDEVQVGDPVARNDDAMPSFAASGCTTFGYRWLTKLLNSYFFPPNARSVQVKNRSCPGWLT